MVDIQSSTGTDDDLAGGLFEDNLRQTGTVVPPDDIITPEVLRRLRDGDHESYEKVYLHWRRPIYRFVFSVTGTEEDADDITQEIFAVLWNYRDKIDPDRNIRSFLYLVARRIAYKSNRSKLIRKRYAGSFWAEEIDNFTSHDIVVEKEMELLQQALLQRMPSSQRRIFEMSHNEGLSIEEISEQLGIKRESVYNQLSKARKSIRDAILILLFLLQ